MMIIADRLADQALDHIETVFDMMFVKSPDISSVSVELFKEFIIRDLKANLSERDIDLFIKSHPLLSQGHELSKIDLLNIFEEPFRVAQYKQIEKDSIMKQQKSQAEMIFGTQTPMNYNSNRSNRNLINP